jgi:hypothetical protein
LAVSDQRGLKRPELLMPPETLEIATDEPLEIRA